jgi:galactokinase
VDIESLKKEFEKIYGEGDARAFHSPGRVNLIGEHIDYNGGYVFPCALEFGTYGYARKREDCIINLASTDFSLKVSVDLNSIEFKKEDDWANYPKGVIKIMLNKGYRLSGMDILVSGNIPNGAGLSSSASLEVLISVVVNNLCNNGSIDKVELVKLSQEAENKFVGVNCGIMDQFAVGMGKTNKAILLDCSTLKYSYADINLGDYSLVIMNTNKRRALNESKYNERRAECEEALRILSQQIKVNSLCELGEEEFEAVKNCIENEVVQKRAEHAVYENGRVKKAYEALNNGELLKFGKLLTASHDSLKNLYEVTGRELDAIVEEALKCEGCIGARMTGAGFGGCAIAVVKRDAVSSFIKNVEKEYLIRTGLKADFYISGIGEGTREL